MDLSSIVPISRKAIPSNPRDAQHSYVVYVKYLAFFIEDNVHKEDDIKLYNMHCINCAVKSNISWNTLEMCSEDCSL